MYNTKVVLGAREEVGLEVNAQKFKCVCVWCDKGLTISDDTNKHTYMHE